MIKKDIKTMIIKDIVNRGSVGHKDICSRVHFSENVQTEWFQFFRIRNFTHNSRVFKILLKSYT